MLFIFLNHEEHRYSTVIADTVLDALRQHIEQQYFSDHGMKAFAILCESGKMEMSELITYANQHFLHNEINEIYALGERVFPLEY